MSCPGDIDQVIRQFKKDRIDLTSDQIIMAAGGDHKKWADYLKGPKAQALIRQANVKLVQENHEIVSRGQGTERWRMVTCAQARIEQAHQQTAKASNHLRNAEDNMWLVAKDERAPQSLRQDAIAWLELFTCEKGARNMLTYQEWADELVKKLPTTGEAA